MDSVYIVVGFKKQSNDSIDSAVMGAYSSHELATTCGDRLVKSKIVDSYDIENPIIDEYGYE